MPINTVEKVIDGHEIKINQFHAIRGFKMKARLMKLILPVLSPLLGGLDLKKGKDLLDGNIDIQSALPKAIVALSENLDEDIFFNLLIDLFSATFVDSRELNKKSFDELFIGDYFLVYKIAYEVIMANGFFGKGGIGTILGSVTENETEVSPK